MQELYQTIDQRLSRIEAKLDAFSDKVVPEVATLAAQHTGMQGQIKVIFTLITGAISAIVSYAAAKLLGHS